MQLSSFWTRQNNLQLLSCHPEPKPGVRSLCGLLLCLRSSRRSYLLCCGLVAASRCRSSTALFSAETCQLVDGRIDLSLQFGVGEG